MEEYLVYRDHRVCGSIRAEQQGLYTSFSADCDGQEERLYSLYLEGERGSVLLGVPEWREGRYVLRRTLANREWEPVGAVRCARLKERGVPEQMGASEQADGGWMRLEHPEYFFRCTAPQLAVCGPCYWKQAADGRYLAVPLDAGRPFLLPRYFCFARVEQLWGKSFAIFFFDTKERPCLR